MKDGTETMVLTNVCAGILQFKTTLTVAASVVVQKVGTCHLCH